MSPLPNYLIVDGHNVMHAWPELAAKVKKVSKRLQARQELLQRLRTYQDVTGDQVVVVFDGRTPQVQEEREPQGLQILTADADHSADNLIEMLANKYGRERRLKVVTADMLVGEGISASGAEWVSPEGLRNLCDDAEKRLQTQLEKLRTRRNLLLAGSGAVLSSLFQSQPVLASPQNWEKLAQYAFQRRTRALLVQSQGRIVFEQYSGRQSAPVMRIYSGTKAFWGLAFLAAAEDDLLDLDAPVSEELPEWQQQGVKANITLRQLLHMTAGLEKGLQIHQDGLRDRNQIALSQPLVSAPGERFLYGPSQLQVAHEVLKRVLSRKKRPSTPTAYLEQRVLHPLGLGAQRYLPDASGHPLIASGFALSARDWARLGECILQRGKPILSRNSYQMLLTGSSANPAYAFGFWNNQMCVNSHATEREVEDMLEKKPSQQHWAHTCLAHGLPADLLACIGSWFQRLFACPSQGWVVVRQGEDAAFSDADFLRLALQAIQGAESHQ